MSAYVSCTAVFMRELMELTCHSEEYNDVEAHEIESNWDQVVDKYVPKCYFMSGSPYRSIVYLASTTWI